MPKPKPVTILVTDEDDLAADLLVLHLQQTDAAFLRFNQDSFPADTRLSCSPDDPLPNMEIDGHAADLRNIRSAWYRRPPQHRPLHGRPKALQNYVAGEAAALLDGLWRTAPWLWMNAPSSVQKAENKVFQLALARAIGLPTPKTIVTNSIADATAFCNDRTCIIKPLKAGAVPDDDEWTPIYTTRLEQADLSDPAAIEASPVILQELIDVHYELRVTLVNKYLFATKIVTPHTPVFLDWRLHNPDEIRYFTVGIPDALEKNIRQMSRKLELRYASFDFLVAECGDIFFTEVNPSGQWGWIEEHTGQPITAAIIESLLEAQAHEC